MTVIFLQFQMTEGNGCFLDLVFLQCSLFHYFPSQRRLYSSFMPLDVATSGCLHQFKDVGCEMCSNVDHNSLKNHQKISLLLEF